MNLLLALDTATQTTGLALHNGARILAEATWLGGGRQTVELGPQVAILMRRAGITPADLSGVALALGPGSYSGLRVGMAFAKGLALAHGLPMIGVPTLDILAKYQPLGVPALAVVIQAGRRRLSVGRYSVVGGQWKAKGEITNLTFTEFTTSLPGGCYVCGELTAEQRESLQTDWKAVVAPPAMCVRRPAVLADIASLQLRAGQVSKPHQLAPIYSGTVSGS